MSGLPSGLALVPSASPDPELTRAWRQVRGLGRGLSQLTVKTTAFRA